MIRDSKMLTELTVDAEAQVGGMIHRPLIPARSSFACNTAVVTTKLGQVKEVVIFALAMFARSFISQRGKE
jgi:hypothetical protein